MRVVSLACSNTEIVCALGAGHLLVGVDDHSDTPADVVARLPRVGPDLEIDVGRVAALEPDLVLASLTVPGHERVVADLERAGLPFLAPEPTRLEHVFDDIRRIGGALGMRERAERLAADLERDLEPAPAPDARPRILVQWWPRPVIAPGRLSWVHDLIERAGGTNPLGHEDVKSRPLTDDEVARLDPHAIVLAWCGVKPERYRPDVVFGNPAWQGVRAVRSGHVHCVPEAHLGRPGPGLRDGFRALRRIVRAAGS